MLAIVDTPRGFRTRGPDLGADGWAVSRYFETEEEAESFVFGVELGHERGWHDGYTQGSFVTFKSHDCVD